MLDHRAVGKRGISLASAVILKSVRRRPCRIVKSRPEAPACKSLSTGHTKMYRHHRAWAESVGLWDMYAVACADADIDACPQPTMPVVPVCLYILVRPLSTKDMPDYILPHFHLNADFILQSSSHIFLKMSTAKNVVACGKQVSTVFVKARSSSEPTIRSHMPNFRPLMLMLSNLHRR